MTHSSKRSAETDKERSRVQKLYPVRSHLHQDSRYSGIAIASFSLRLIHGSQKPFPKNLSWKFEELRKLDANAEESKYEEKSATPNFRQQQDLYIKEMQRWTHSYFEPYRPKDREQLAMGLLEPFYFVLFETSAEYFGQQPQDERTEFFGRYLKLLIDNFKPDSVN